ELTARAPLNGPALHLAVLVRRFDVHERVRVAEEELHQIPLNRHRLILEVGCRERMVGLYTRASHHSHSGNEQNQERTFHVCLLLTEPVFEGRASQAESVLASTFPEILP